MLEACDPDTYVDAHGWPERENDVGNEQHSLLKYETWDLVPQPQEMDAVKWWWV